MSKEIGIAIILGLMLFTIGKVSESKTYTKSQKNTLYITLFLCFPIGLVLMGIYNLSSKN
jgi:hypothetical protein